MNENQENSETNIEQLPKSAGVYVVGIGASAGGLEALRELLSKLEFHPRITFVVVQHLSPTHTSMLKTLLARESVLNVEELTDSIVPLPSSVYITPPNKDVVLRDGVLHLMSPKVGIGPKPSIDRFFASMAEDAGENAIGIILSGTGADGARGLLSIKSAGGTTIVQDPATAKYDGMPMAALQSNTADLILPPSKMGAALLAFITAGTLIPESLENKKEETGVDIYEMIIAKTKEITGFNLSQYKRSTIDRRIKRRMALYHLTNMREYLEYLENNEEEVENFAKDVLISVTEFFRDSDAFEALANIIEALVERAPLDRPLRAWVPGCATGEEAFSIAVLFEEAIRRQKRARSYQIFATDIDINATNRGRQGSYPQAAFEKMPLEWRDRYFIQEGGSYIARKNLRENIIFSVHNLIQDPPFSRVDFISCRNLLIYFTTVLQKRVLEIFHYSLNPHGVLFLGKSETISQHEDLYTPINKSKRIYRKVGDRRIYRPFSAALDFPATDSSGTKNKSRRDQVDPISAKLDQAIHRAYGPPCVIISTNDEVIHISGDISDYLTLHTGPTGLSIYDLISNNLRAELRALIYKSRRETKVVKGGRHSIQTNNKLNKDIRIAVRPLDPDSAALLLVCFEEVEEKSVANLVELSKREQNEDPVILELEHELATTREHLQTVVEELETSNEELQSVNEELQSANEELQSTNEELQTSNEELQSTNEELLTVNDEIQVKSRELENIATDLQNIQDSINFPLVVVDNQLRITRFVPALDQLIPIKEIHHGESITSLAWRMEIPRLRQLILRVFKNKKPYQDQIRVNHQTYQMHIVPYIDKTSEVAGAVLLFYNTTDFEKIKHGLLESQERLQNIIDNIVDGLITIDDKGKILVYSRSAEKIFGYTNQEVIGKNISILMPDDQAASHDASLTRYLDTGHAYAIGTQREVQGKRKDGHVFPMELSVSEMHSQGHRTFTGLVRDITQRKIIDTTLFNERERALVTLHSITDAVITTDNIGNVDFLNRAAEKITGWSCEEANDKPINKIFKIIDEHTREPKVNPVHTVLSSGDALGMVNGTLLRSKPGREYTIEHSASPIRDQDGKMKGVVVVFRDVSETHQILRQMAWQARHDPLTGLLNRKEMESRLEHALTSAKSFKREHALLYVDLDQFKVVNDTCGHQAGDDLLRQVSGQLGVNLRHRDALGRLGGDEFAVLLENCSLNQAQQIAESIKKSVEEFRFIWDEKVFKIGASIGVVSIDENSVDMTQILSDADAACYGAKEAGRNRVQLHSPDDAQLASQRRQMHWVTNINQVLDENRFRLYFQRIQPLGQATKKSHWEVLLRMIDEDKELVLPGVFLPAAERYDLMQKIDRWVLRSTLSLLSGAPIKEFESMPYVAINLSGRSLSDEQFLSFVDQQFESFTVPASHVCFEITETAAIANFVKAREFIKAMRKRGCRFALDDFGSGMSSFGYLKSLTVDYIKIDGSFVRNINHDIVDLAMVESINRIGSLMEIETIAEFAESDEIIAKLHQIGVDYAQGFGVQHPISSEEFLGAIQ